MAVDVEIETCSPYVVGIDLSGQNARFIEEWTGEVVTERADNGAAAPAKHVGTIGVCPFGRQHAARHELVA